jgi:NADH-quinone oxidoreductase subunit N
MQTEIKRMLGYSTISHVGFMLLGLSALEHNGAGTGYFYVITYAISAAAVMAVVIIVSKSEDEQGGVEIANLRGLNKQSPGLALVLLLGMMSMAGVPVLMGFFAKLAVIQSIISAGYLWLAVIAVVFSVIGAFYYLRVVKAAYFDEIDQPLHFLKLGLDSKIFLTVNAALILLIGLMPQTLLELCQKLFQ